MAWRSGSVAIAAAVAGAVLVLVAGAIGSCIGASAVVPVRVPFGTAAPLLGRAVPGVFGIATTHAFVVTGPVGAAFGHHPADHLLESADPFVQTSVLLGQSLVLFREPSQRLLQVPTGFAEAALEFHAAFTKIEIAFTEHHLGLAPALLLSLDDPLEFVFERLRELVHAFVGHLRELVHAMIGHLREFVEAMFGLLGPVSASLGHLLHPARGLVMGLLHHPVDVHQHLLPEAALIARMILMLA
ncbi:MAG: hypothetical protein CMJ27_08350 [Phycisphaerae bacterium]|nr:hypothetical protein [Phycisphaerae bacterium]